ncbi:MAG: hypothetical protein R6V59_00400 [Dehalococcoidia bacterium]
MKRETQSRAAAILPVHRLQEQARQTYDRLSRYYDSTLAVFRRKYAEMALKRLSIAEKVKVFRLRAEVIVVIKAMRQRVPATLYQTGLLQLRHYSPTRLPPLCVR